VSQIQRQREKRDVRRVREPRDGATIHEGPTPLFRAGRSGGKRELLEALSFSERELRDRSMEITSCIASGDVVAFEAIWRATVAGSGARAPVGAKLEARLAQFVRMKDGKIISSHEYVCAPTVESPGT
jgi:ketosteroid isomerase-like protein